MRLKIESISFKRLDDSKSSFVLKDTRIIEKARKLTYILLDYEN